MPLLPAICDSCGRLWVPNAISIENSTGISLKDIAVSPCPYCGQTGHIPDGIYDATAEGIRIVATSSKSASSLATLQRLLAEARAANSSAEATAEAIESQAPEFRLLAELVRRLKGVPIATWLALILAAVTIVQAEVADKRQGNIEAKVDQIYQQVINQAVTTPTASPAPVPRVSPGAAQAPKVGRNDPCPCGSGLKYKRCHGR
jgi:hypothetical protein